MKLFLTIVFIGCLSVYGYGQTRNVLVGTNSAVVQPTNFWSADAVNARAGLGLGSAATNPASAFQPSSTNLTLLANGDGSTLTNLNLSGLESIAITNIAGLQDALDTKLATNGSAANLTSFPPSILQTTSALTNFPVGLLRTNGDGSGLVNLPVPAFASNVLATISLDKGGTGATNASGARINLGATTVGSGVFTAVDAPAARTVLGLGTSATNTSTAFQPSSSVLTNLANNNGGSLTNVTAGNIVGTVGLASNITGTAPLASNITGIVSLANGGTGGTNAATARSGIGLGTTNTLTIAGLFSQNLTIAAGGGITLQSTLTNANSFRTNIGLPWTGLTNTDAASFRTALSLGTAATNPATAFQSSSLALSNLATGNGGALSNLQATNLVGVIPASNIATVTLTNISGTLGVASGGTGATNAANARQNLGSTFVGDAVFIATNQVDARTAIGALATNGNGAALTNLTAANITGTVAITNGGSGATTAGGARTNFGLGATWLTNNNVTNFRTAIGLGATNNVSFASVDAGVLQLNSGNGALFFYDLDGTSDIFFFDGGEPDIARARTNLGLGATNNVTFNSLNLGVDINISDVRMTGYSVVFDLEEAIFKVSGADWNFDGSGIVNTGPISFFNTTNAATTRTNLGLGATNNVTFSSVNAGTVNSLNLLFGDTNARIETIIEDGGITFVLNRGTNQDVGLLNFGFTNNTIEAFVPIGFNNNTTNAAITRTNLGLYNTNEASVYAAFALWDGPNDTLGFAVNDDVVRLSPFVVSTNAPTNTTNAVRWIEVIAGTNTYRLPLYQ